MVLPQWATIPAGLAVALLLVFQHQLETGGPVIPKDPRDYIVAAVGFVLVVLTRSLKTGDTPPAQGEHAP